MAEMLINGIDIKSFSARLQNYSLSGTAVTNNTASAGTLVVFPDLFYVTFEPRTLNITMTFFPKRVGEDSRRTSIPERLHRATENMIRFESLIVGKVVEIQLPDGYHYTALVQSLPAPSFDSTGEHDVTYTFLAIRHLPARKAAVSVGGTIKCISNTDTKCIIKASFSQAHENVTLCGVTVSDISQNDVLIIDSVHGLITCNGDNKFLDSDLNDFPILTPGDNTISCTAADASLEVTYTPVFA